MLKFRGKRLVAIGTLMVSLFAFGCGEDKQDDPTPKEQTYEIRVIRTDISGLPFSVNVATLPSGGRPGNPYGNFFIDQHWQRYDTDGTSTAKPMDSPELKSGAEVAIEITIENAVSKVFRPGSAVTVELWRDDNKKMGQLSFTSSDAANQSHWVKYNYVPVAVEHGLKKRVQFTLE